MKKKLLATAASAMLMTGVAHAQSSVTLYGLIDDGITYNSNSGGKSSFSMISGETVGSRWGLRGVEDLGGGLSAIFRLESGFNIANGTSGQGGSAFGRQAYVGIDSKQYGTFTLGRQYDAPTDMWSGFTAAGATLGDFGAHIMDNDNADWDWRQNNSVKYVSPVIAGFQGEATYGFSNSTNFAANRSYSVAGTYTLGQFSAAAGYSKQTAPSSNATGSISSTTSFGFLGASQQNIDAAVRWTFADNSNIAFAYSHTDVYAANGIIGSNVSGPTAATNQNSWKFNNFELNGQYYITPSLWAAAEYTYTMADVHAAQSAAGRYHQAGLMLNYALSKRTSVYVQGAYMHGNKAAASTLGVSIEGLGLSSSENQTLARVGIQHAF